MSMIKSNKARCKVCGDEIESKYLHDLVTCSCYVEGKDNEGIFVDGGRCYLRRGGNMDNFIDLHEERESKGGRNG